MTEHEKREQGFLYDANHDETIWKEIVKCKDLCFEYNQLKPSQVEQQQSLIRQLFGRTGKRFQILAPFWCDYGYNIEIGENFYANHNCTILDGARVKFGSNVFIAPGCVFSTAGHPLDTEQRNLGLEYAYPITVGDNVWFGAHVTVLPGVTIGSDCVIGAGSIVTRDIPSGVIAVGNPCRVLRKITEADKKKYAVYGETGT